MKSTAPEIAAAINAATGSNYTEVFPQFFASETKGKTNVKTFESGQIKNVKLMLVHPFTEIEKVDRRLFVILGTGYCLN